MVKKLIHVFNPFNGTPFKTSALLAVVCAISVAVSLTLMPVVFKEAKGEYLPITAATTPIFPESVHIGESYKGTRTICVSEDTNTKVSGYWVQVFEDGSEGQIIKTQTDVPNLRKKGCTDIERVSTPPQGVVPGIWKIKGQEVATSSKGEVQAVFLEGGPIEVLP